LCGSSKKIAYIGYRILNHQLEYLLFHYRNTAQYLDVVDG